MLIAMSRRVWWLNVNISVNEIISVRVRMSVSISVVTSKRRPAKITPYYRIQAGYLIAISSGKVRFP